MSGEIDGIGELVTGGLIARAVEPAAGSVQREGSGHCLNCGTRRIGEFCHVCGQNSHIHRSLSAFWHDLLHGVLHFEGKIWRTLPMLFFRPGELTRRYIHGERARFISPLAMFLFTVFMMFAIFQMLGLSADSVASLNGSSGEERKGALQRLGEEELAEKQAERQRLAAQGKPTAEVDRAIKKAEAELAELKDSGLGDLEGSAKFTSNINSGWRYLDERIAHGVQKTNKNPSLMLYKLQSNGYKFSWLLIPISAPFVWLLFFWKRQYKLYDHVVFVTYSIAFMSLLAIALTLVGLLSPPEPLIPLAAVFVPPLHMYRQMRGAYSLTRSSAIIRTFLLILLSTLALMIFFVIMLLLGFG